MMNFCTLFDSKYAAKGLALYRSMQRHFKGVPFRLHVLALDDAVNAAFGRVSKDSGVVDSVIVANVEDLVNSQPGLARCRNSRTYPEWCWTLGSVWTKVVRDTYRSATYLDSDLFFFSDVRLLLEEIKEASIVITPHRFAPKWSHYIKNGIYNVSWVGFSGDEESEWCLNRWASQCIAWCYLRNEDGKYADQGYLDSWPDEYRGVHPIEHIGAGTAPWNLQGYAIGGTPGSPTVDGVPVIWYHMHEFLDRGKGQYRYTNYPLRPDDKAFIYVPYVEAIEEAKRELRL